MNERLLQYIWQFQHFNGNDLETTSGEKLIIIHPGHFNQHQGPDFKEGKVRLEDNIWVGNIELHINASDWHRHAHSGDPNYNNVILHVVWNNDEQENVRKIPTLILQDRVSKILMHQYETWMKDSRFIPCEATIASIEPLVMSSWLERLMIERLTRKAIQVEAMLETNRYHWEEVMWWMLAANCGLYVNTDAFREMAMSIPYNVVVKHRGQIHQLEAMMLGQCGLIDAVEKDKYALMLAKEYDFLRKKYALKKTFIRVNFLRMRPACFPTVRLAQLAMLMHSTENIFSFILSASGIATIKKMLGVVANDYWHYHFRFGEETSYQPKTLGSDMINSVIVNAITVMLFAYGKHHREQVYQDKAIEWMKRVAAENNAVIRGFKKTGVHAVTARDSQSLLELKSSYCDHKRCLDCAIANNILKGNVSTRL